MASAAVSYGVCIFSCWLIPVPERRVGGGDTDPDPELVSPNSLQISDIMDLDIPPRLTLYYSLFVLIP
jgi:hypothetical protein